MLNKVIFILENHFNKRDSIRYGFDIFKKYGFDISVIEVSKLLHPIEYQSIIPPDSYSFSGLIKINNYNELKDEIFKINAKASWIVLNLNFSEKTKTIFKIISKRDIRYSVLFSRTVPYYDTKNTNRVIFKKFFSNNLLKLINKKIFKIIPFKYFGVNPADLVLYPTRQDVNKNLPISKKTKIVLAHSFDYDNYLRQKKKESLISEKYAVFIDGYMPFHPDHIMEGKGHFLNPVSYFNNLNNFFDQFEVAYNMKVIIAIHPRADKNYGSIWYKERKSIYNETVRLVRDASAVIFHNSFSVQYAVLFNKPIFPISTKSIDEGIYRKFMPGPPVSWFADFFEKNIEYIDDESYKIKKHSLLIDQNKYNKFKNLYIKDDSSSDIPYWEIFISHLNKLNN